MSTTPIAPTSPEPGVSRRAALVGACAAGCAVVLAGCATYSATPSPEPAPAPSGGTGGGGPAPAPAQPGGAAVLVRTADVPVGGGVILPAQQVVVTQPTAGQFKAFSSVCTHQGCEVGTVANGSIECPCHGSFFSITDGAPTEGPARRPLPAKAITVSGDGISLA